MKYLVLGAGGTGGSIAAFLGRSKMDVSLIARGQHLVNLKQRMVFKNDTKVEVFDNIKAYSAEEYIRKGEKPDVIFLCTKSYSLEQVAPFIQEAAGPKTVVIPILNGIAIGNKVRGLLPDVKVADGCIYIVAEKTGEGRILMKGTLMRVVFGSSDKEIFEILKDVYNDLLKTDITVVLSANIMRDTFRKFALVSAMAACGVYFEIPTGPVQKEGEERKFFLLLAKELAELAEKQGFTYDFDLMEKNMSVMDRMNPTSTSSLQRDLAKGGQSEADSLIAEPIRLGEAYGLPMEAYRKVAAKLTLSI